jgi:CRP-like cAMP-binding protein
MPALTPHEILISEPSHGTRYTLYRGGALTDVTEQGSGDFVLVESGAVVLYAKAQDGNRLYLSIVSEGHVFSPQSVEILHAGTDRYCAQAMREMTVRRIPRQHWNDICAAHPGLYHKVIEQEAHLLGIVQFHLAQHFQRSSLDRARFALCTYAHGLGKSAPSGGRTIRVSRAELASWIGVSSDRMCRLIRELHEAGEVTVIGRNINVSNDLLAHHYPRHA